jgi:hypothetical protein
MKINTYTEYFPSIIAMMESIRDFEKIILNPYLKKHLVGFNIETMPYFEKITRFLWKIKSESMNNIHKMLDKLIDETSNIIYDYGLKENGMWYVSGECE